MLGVRPSRHGHHHDRRKVYSLHHFSEILQLDCNSCLNGSHGCFFNILLVVVSINKLDMDSIDGFEKTMPGLHLNPEGEELECYSGDVCKIKVSGDYKALWQWFWMRNNLTYDTKPGDREVRNNRLCCEV
jgi:hypothetical protein